MAINTPGIIPPISTLLTDIFARLAKTIPRMVGGIIMGQPSGPQNGADAHFLAVAVGPHLRNQGRAQNRHAAHAGAAHGSE